MDKILNEAYLDIRKIAGSETVSRDHGETMRKIIDLLLKKKDRVIIDFSNVSLASPSFIDEAFVLLLDKHSLDELKKKIEFKDMTEFDRALLNKLFKARIQEKKQNERTHGSKAPAGSKRRRKAG